MNAEKVVKLDNYLYEEIEAFFNELEVGSKGTRTMYEKDIRQFFKAYKNKDIEHLSEDDLKVKKKDMINYRKYLQDNFTLANSTINNKITAVKRLYYYLSDEYDVNMTAFNFKSLKEQVNSYGTLSQTEAERFAETAFQTEREKPYLKKMLILFAIRTSFRINEILNLKWNDFEEGEGFVKVTTKIGKGGKQNTTSISVNLYNQICELKEINSNSKWKDPNIVFQISEDAVNQMMKRLRERMNIPAERNIVFHSFRGVAIDMAYEEQGIRAAALQGNHSDINTTYKHYINKSKDYSNTVGVRMDEEFNLIFLDEMSVEDFKSFIRNSPFRTQLEIKSYYEKNVKVKKGCNRVGIDDYT